MKLAEQFAEFHERIQLGPAQVERITSATNALVEHLTEELGLSPDEIFLQGSYANGTAVRPDPDSSDGEYDVDMVAICARPDATPEEALSELREAIAAHGRYTEMIEDDPQRPCIRLRYADDQIGGFHVDVVPARRRPFGAPLEIPRPGVGWSDSDPQAYTDWSRAQGEQFARTVQALKRWRDHSQAAHRAVKSIVLQVLVAQGISGHVDDAERLASTLRSIADRLATDPGTPPVIANPVLPQENLAERWEPDQYDEFCEIVTAAAEAAEAALAEPDGQASAAQWQDLLGSSFPSAGSAAAAEPGADRAPGEQDLERDFGIPIRLSGNVTITARTRPKPGFRAGSVAGSVQKDRSLVFQIGATSVPKPFQVYWKVRNFGADAERAGGLRGEIREDPRRDDAYRSETTRYVGDHYVEVYVVKEGVCVARARKAVRIR